MLPLLLLLVEIVVDSTVVPKLSGSDEGSIDGIGDAADEIGKIVEPPIRSSCSSEANF